MHVLKKKEWLLVLRKKDKNNIYNNILEAKHTMFRFFVLHGLPWLNKNNLPKSIYLCSIFTNVKYCLKSIIIKRFDSKFKEIDI